MPQTKCRSKSLGELGAMSYAVARTLVDRAPEVDSYLRAVCTPAGTRLAEEELVLLERPPIATLA